MNSGRPKKYDFVSMRAEFLASAVSIREMATKRNVPHSYLAKMASLGRWHEQRAELQSKARAEVAEMVMASAQDRCAAMESGVSLTTAAKQLERSKATGDKLYMLFQAAVGALEAGDMRLMRQAVDMWVALDDHMRKVHGLDVQRERPLVNIQVMSALPDGSEAMKAVLPVEVVEVGLVPVELECVTG